jgi:hypothetical protein
VERAVALETEAKIRRESFLIGPSIESNSKREVSFSFVPGEEDTETLVKRFREYLKKIQGL